MFEITSEFKNSSPCHQSQNLSRFPDIRLSDRLPSDRWPCGASGLERVQSRFLALDLSRLKGAICFDFFSFFFFNFNDLFLPEFRPAGYVLYWQT